MVFFCLPPTLSITHLAPCLTLTGRRWSGRPEPGRLRRVSAGGLFLHDMGLHSPLSNLRPLFNRNKQRKTTLGRRRTTHQAHICRHVESNRHRERDWRKQPAWYTHRQNSAKCAAERSARHYSFCNVVMDTRRTADVALCRPKRASQLYTDLITVTVLYPRALVHRVR